MYLSSFILPIFCNGQECYLDMLILYFVFILSPSISVHLFSFTVFPIYLFKWTCVAELLFLNPFFKAISDLWRLRANPRHRAGIRHFIFRGGFLLHQKKKTHYTTYIMTLKFTFTLYSPTAMIVIDSRRMKSPPDTFNVSEVARRLFSHFELRLYSDCYDVVWWWYVNIEALFQKPQV